jgi:hypothetical protein
LKGGLYTIEILGLVHCNVWGLGKTTSLGEVWYFLTFIDDYFRIFFAILEGKGIMFFQVFGIQNLC